MIKNFLFAVVLLSLALAVGCAKGGNGVGSGISVTVSAPSDINADALYPGQQVTLTAATTHPTYASVNWSLGAGCTPSTCGTILSTTPPTGTTSATALYQATTTPLLQTTVTATLVSDSSVMGSLGVTVADVTTDVSPATLSVGKGLTQQFAAVAVPDDAPQTFTWTCTANGVQCANFTQDPNVSGLAYYEAQDNCGSNCVQISAASTLDPTGCSTNPKNCTIASASLVASRINGTYGFRFSGYDNNNKATAVVGTFTASNGTITTGVEDALTSSGPAQYTITGGTYTPTSSDTNNSNNAGTLTLTFLPVTGVYPNQFQVALDGAGDLEMIESDGKGTGSGIAQKSSATKLFTGAQTYAFGFTGVDSGGNRVGYVGLLPMNGSGTVASNGQMDVNDNGNSTNICGAGPCSVSGSYSVDACNCGLYHMTLTSGSDATMKFDFFISSGTANNKTNKNPLTFYAISTDPASNPAVSGTMVLQDSPQTYNDAFLNGTSVSALTGTGTDANGTIVPGTTNVSLTLGTTDGSGNFSGQFDQNNDSVILSSAQFPPTGSTSYIYAASGTNNGRYTFNMLGNPTTTPVGPPLPFILYASGANRGFLLDKSSSSVMTGTMNPQGKGSGLFGNSELPGTYAAATTSSGSSGAVPLAANLLATIQTTQATGALTYNISGTQYPPYTPTVAGTYTIQDVGNGTIALTAPSTQSYVIYALDTSGACTPTSPVCAIQDFLMMETCTPQPPATTCSGPPNASIIFAKQ